MNLPNKLTIFRIILIPFILIFMIPFTFISKDSAWAQFVRHDGMIIALALFVVASVTDTVDGYIARKYKIVTNLGKFLDPIADKLLVAAVLTALVELGKVTSWAAIIIISREFIVTGIRLLAAEKKVVIAASYIGKVKTVIQISAIIIIMINAQIAVFFPNWAGLTYTGIFSDIVLISAVIMTLISGYDYLRKNIHFVKE